MTLRVELEGLRRVQTLRRREWEALAAGVAGSGGVREDGARLVVRPDRGAVSLRLDDDAGATLLRARLTADDLGGTVEEYVEIIRQMAYAADESHRRLEVLDMAKKVAHDRGGETMTRVLGDLGLDHATGRKLFSLVVSILVETPRLTPGISH